MESRLTKLEMDAVFQLIQLSGCSSDDDFPVFWVNLPVETDEQHRDEDEGKAEETLSSSSINQEKCFDEPLPRTKPKFGSLVDIYTKTQPLIKKKRARF